MLLLKHHVPPRYSIYVITSTTEKKEEEGEGVSGFFSFPGSVHLNLKQKQNNNIAALKWKADFVLWFSYVFSTLRTWIVTMPLTQHLS
mmetsp:Transcript_32584/g.37073  ORF Transcript_32584/g.37073 Transcript_32584/m.37073 type:complete len:88 (+) Transcript_32584:60-323(+)